MNINDHVQDVRSVSVTEIITTHFHVPAETLPICDKYYILYWQSRFLYTQLLRSPRIIREGIAFVPVLQENLSMEFIGTNPEMQIRLSFRRIRGHKTGYVIIRPGATVTMKLSKRVRD